MYFDQFKGTQQHKVICIRFDVTIISNMSFSLINERILWATIFNMLIKAVYCLIKMSTSNSKMYCSFCCGTLLSTESNVEIHIKCMRQKVKRVGENQSAMRICSECSWVEGFYKEHDLGYWPTNVEEFKITQFNIQLNKKYPIPVFSCFCQSNTGNYIFFTVQCYIATWPHQNTKHCGFEVLHLTHFCLIIPRTSKQEQSSMFSIIFTNIRHYENSIF